MTDIPPLVQAARKLIAGVKDKRLPEGPLNDSFDEKLLTGRGLTTLLRGMAEFVDQYQDIVSIPGNAGLLERLRGKDDKDIAALLSDIALGDNSAAVKTQLAAALALRDENVFDKLLMAIKTLARERQLQLNDNFRDEDDRQEKRPMTPREIEEEQKRREALDKGTPYESQHNSPDQRPISDRDIHNSAKDFDKQGGGIDDKGIKKSAQESGEEFKPGNEPDAYQHQEKSGHLAYLLGQQEEAAQIQRYYDLAMMLKQRFARCLRSVLSGPGQENQR